MQKNQMLGLKKEAKIPKSMQSVARVRGQQKRHTKRIRKPEGLTKHSSLAVGTNLRFKHVILRNAIIAAGTSTLVQTLREIRNLSSKKRNL